MKKGKLFLTILASMALVACNEPTSTSGSTSKPSTSDSVSTSTVEKFNVEVVGGTGGGNDITSGSSVTVVANEPEEGKKFVKWVDENGNTVSTDKSYTFTVAKSVKLTATYETLKFQVTITDGTGSGEYEYGASATIQASVTKGKEFIAWLDASGKEVSKDNPYTFVVKSDVTLFAEFKEAFVEPQNIDDVKSLLAKSAKAQVNTASMTSKAKTTAYNARNNYAVNSETEYNETANMYADNIMFATGKNSTGEYEKALKIENNQLLSVLYYPKALSYYSSAVKYDIVDEVIDEDAQVTLENAQAQVFANNLVSTLLELFNDYKLENVDSVTCTSDSNVHNILINAHYAPSGYESTKYCTIEINIVLNQYFIKSASIVEKEYVRATQFENGVLKEDAKALNKYETTYICDQLSSDKVNAPDTVDINKYFISSFDFSGKYSDGVSTKSDRKFNKDNNKIALNAEISSYYLDMSNVLPATSIEKNTLTIKSVGDENIFKVTKNSSGKISSIKAIAVGKTTITVSSVAGCLSSYEVEVVENLAPVSFEVDCLDKVLVGEEIELNVKNIRPDTSNKNVTWSVNNADMAEIVNKDGKFFLKGKGDKTGFVTITATSNSDNSVSASKDVFISQGALSQDALREAVKGTWVKMSYSGTSIEFTFSFNDDGTFTAVDNVRKYNKITGNGNWEVSTDKDSSIEDNFSSFGHTNVDDYLVVKITNYTLTDESANGSTIEIHFAIAPEGYEMYYHFRIGSGSLSSVSTIEGKVIKQ